ncbi:MAG: GNAT family N-acetyltransferase [Bacilli bacterium]|jgi:predicted acetyltransferase/8-oxo-dGTP pyrophosphatase MutT (NUDIX family)|nr:GNAT family N-acetyltransferase [Bacilli bacterium]
MEKEKSCGAVIYKYLGKRLVFLVAKMNRGHYSLIKGHIEDGESEIMTAYREIKEETNLDVVIDNRFREVIAYSPYRDNPKIIKDVVFFVATPVGGRIKRQSSEVDVLSWCGYRKALTLITHESDRDILRKAKLYLANRPIIQYENEDLIRLVIPSKMFLKSYLETKMFLDHTGDGFVNPFVPNVLAKIVDARHGKNLPYGWVSGTYLWLVKRKQFIGEISIRHDLTDLLLRFGGHIGYRVRQDQRRRGYGTKMLALALDYIREIFGFRKVLITCDESNVGSIKIIEKNGGILHDKVTNLIEGQERITRRYWVDVK